MISILRFLRGQAAAPIAGLRQRRHRDDAVPKIRTSARRTRGCLGELRLTGLRDSARVRSAAGDCRLTTTPLASDTSGRREELPLPLPFAGALLCSDSGRCERAPIGFILRLPTAQSSVSLA